MANGDRYPVPESQCPNCGTKCETGMSTQGAGPDPKEGDISVCVQCHEVLAYGPGMALVFANWDELPKDLRDHITDCRIELRDIKRKRQ